MGLLPTAYLIFCCQHFVLCWTCFRGGGTIAKAITLICRGGGGTVTVFPALGMVGDSEEELWTETASFASSSATVASVTAGEDRGCPASTSCSSFSVSRRTGCTLHASKVHSVQGFEGAILCTALFICAWRWLMAQGASHAASLLWAKAVVEESPTSWLPICCDQPLRLRRSINCTTTDEVMQDRSTSGWAEAPAGRLSWLAQPVWL